jgi:hypothetical protein
VIRRESLLILDGVLGNIGTQRSMRATTPEKDTFFEVDIFIELKAYDEMHLDSSLSPNMWQQLREITNNGRNVYYFARPWK